MINFTKAQESDLQSIVKLLIEDDLGSKRESLSDTDLANYKTAFDEIQNDKNQILLVGKIDEEIVATCQLTIIANLTFKGAKRLQIEGVRVGKKFRGQKIGKKMLEKTLEIARENNCKIAQLTTNKVREGVVDFYKKSGFVDSHVGMKVYLE